MAKTWFITGTSSGFGRAITERLLGRGQIVAAALRKPKALEHLAAVHGKRLWTEALDVTDPAAVRRVVNKAFSELGRIDVVLNNAGYALFGAAEELSDAQIKRQIDTNLIGSIQVVRAALPHLRAQNGGRILQMSSMGGQLAYPGMSLYHATKWALEGFFEALAQEVADFGIETTIVEPGCAPTNFGGGLDIAEPSGLYDDTQVGDMRRLSASGAFPARSDPQRMAQAIIDSVDRTPAPKRLVLGSDAYAMIRRALTERIAALDAQKAVALLTDFAAAAN